jgi:quercetin dioxygenase-like cupin family protein
MLDRVDGEGGQMAHVWNPQEGLALMIGQMRVTIKVTGAETGGRYALIEVTVPPYFADIWSHLHRHTSEAIYLTQGMLAATLGEETMVVRQGTLILVPPQQSHRLWNPAATPATFLVYYTPAGAEEFFEALSGMAEQGDPPYTPVEIWTLGKDYDYFPG